MVYVNFHKPICPRDFSITIYYFYWVRPTKSIRSQIMRLSINLKKGLQARSASHMSTTLMAGPKGQPYVYNTYGWPEGPAIISRDSSLGRRPSLLIVLYIVGQLINCTFKITLIVYSNNNVKQRYV